MKRKKRRARIGKAGRATCHPGDPEREAVFRAEQAPLLARDVPEEFLHMVNDDRVCRLAIPLTLERMFFQGS